MQVRSLKQNYFLNIFRVVSGAMVGILTMPYINKVLGAESLGKVEYINSIIAYFIMFSALGIPVYGIREVAKVRDDKGKLSLLTIELLCILVITTGLSYLIIFGYLTQLNHFKDLKPLVVLMSSMVLFSNLGVEWFFQGIEDQLYITIRYVVIRIITLILLFVLVRSSADYLNYAFIIVLTTVGSNIFNIAYLFKHIKFKGIEIGALNVKRHLKPILTIFIASVSVSIYLQLDNIMLGSISGQKSVGYYAVANKLIRFVIVFITTLGSVMLPRLSYLVDNDFNLYINYLKKTFNYILFFSIPFCVFFLIMAEELIMIMAGKAFTDSILIMKVLSPIILIVGIAYFIGFMVLYTQGSEKIYTIATLFSAGLSLLLNLYFIPKFGATGTAIVAVLSELLGVIVMVVLGNRYLSKVKFMSRSVVLYSIGGIVMWLIITYVKSFQLTLFAETGIATILSFGGFFMFLYLLQETVVIDMLSLIKSTVRIKSQ